MILAREGVLWDGKRKKWVQTEIPPTQFTKEEARIRNSEDEIINC